MEKKEKNIELARQRIKAYCDQKGMSRADLAVKIGVSASVLSAIENGKENSVSEAMARKILAALSPCMGDIIQTGDFVCLFKSCDFARKERAMIGIIGDTGTGKTTAMRAYAENSRNTYAVTFEKSMNPRRFFAALLREMGVSYEGNINDMVNRIAGEINKAESPLVIVDEAGKITHPIMLHLHDLREKTKGNCGVVLVGMPYFRTNLEKAANRGKEGAAEFLRRINIWARFDGLTPKEAKFAAETFGVTDEDEIKRLSKMRRFSDITNRVLLIKAMEG